MNWNRAQQCLISKISVNDDVNTEKSTFRFVLNNDKHGFIIIVGKDAKVQVTFDMLKICFEGLRRPIGFDRAYFDKVFPKKNKNKPCYFHVIGQLFCKADIAKLHESGHRYYLKVVGNL